jgi:hypothetical protein
MDSIRQRLRKGGSVDDGEAADVLIAGEQSPATWFDWNLLAGKYWAEEVCPCARLDANIR